MVIFLLELFVYVQLWCGVLEADFAIVLLPLFVSDFD